MSIGHEFASIVTSGSMLLALPVAALAGVVSFASPCVLPLVPGYVGFVGGMSGADPEKKGGRGRVLLGVALFIAGFTAVFMVMNFAFSALALTLVRYQDVITRGLGVVVILLGLGFLGAFPFLQRGARLRIDPKAGLAGAPVLGVVFGLGWAPCIGPTLAAVLALAYNESSAGRASLLTLAYCLGLGLPFLLVALGLRSSARMVAWMKRHRVAISRFGGAMLLVIGVLLVTGLWGRLTLQLQGLIDNFDLVI